MLYHLLYPLREVFSGFNLFRYITFRSAYAAISAILFSFILGPFIIRLMERYHVGQVVRKDGPQTHLVKDGTPTMGGLIILLAVLIPTLLFADLKNFYTQLIIFVTVWLGVIGFVDDYLKVVRKMPQGLIARYKMLGQITLGIMVGVAILNGPHKGTDLATATTVPFLKSTIFHWRVFFVPIVIFIITGSSNAVNLTDGLDGLAIGLVGIAFTTFGLICYVTGHVEISRYLNIIYVRGAGELTIYCAAAAGASLGFLWFNANPARVFMGDVGSLALGGVLGTISILVKKELLLGIIGFVFVAEVISVMLQVTYYKRTKKATGTGRRLFKMAPLHHHFELSGWKESQIVIRFWIIGILFAVLSLSTFKIR